MRGSLAKWSDELVNTLQRALGHARENGFSHAGVEHLLLALLDDQDAVGVFLACNVDLDRLRRDLLTDLTKQKLGAEPASVGGVNKQFCRESDLAVRTATTSNAGHALRSPKRRASALD